MIFKNESLESKCVARFEDSILLFLKIFGVASIVVGILNYSLSKNKFGFDVMLYCIDRFNKVSSLLSDEKTKTSGYQKYIYLVNEELFYISSDYIPNEAAKEWIDGMIDMVPIFNSKGEIVNTEYINTFLDDDEIKKLMSDHPRIKGAFVYDDKIDVLYSQEDIPMRMNLRGKFINNVLYRIEKFEY